MGRQESGQATRAFNLGCDARIAGIEISANPYNGIPDDENGSKESLKGAWRRGWIHVHRNWGKHSYSGSGLRSLPPVMEPLA